MRTAVVISKLVPWEECLTLKLLCLFSLCVDCDGCMGG